LTTLSSVHLQPARIREDRREAVVVVVVVVLGAAAVAPAAVAARMPTGAKSLDRYDR
jgi:hypothetical protein